MDLEKVKFPPVIFVVSAVIVIAAVLLCFDELPPGRYVLNLDLSLLFKIRGERRVTDDILFVFIDAEDLQNLNGRTVGRDYFGYMTYVLHELKAETIGFDFLFDTHEINYPGYDENMADFFRTAGNVCLPFAFASMDRPTENGVTSGLLRGEVPSLPIAEFRERTAGLGFSNLGDETVIYSVPIVAIHGDSLTRSFGFELARLFLRDSVSVESPFNGMILAGRDGRRYKIPLDRQGRLILNHFGGIDRIPSMSFVQLLHTFQNSPDSLDLAGKLVLVATTAPGLAPVKITPLCPAFPAALVHLTVAENLINQNALSPLSFLLRLCSVALFAVSPFVLWRSDGFKRALVAGAVILSLYSVIAVIAFCRTYAIFPVFTPFIVFLSFNGLLLGYNSLQRIDRESQRRELLQSQIEKKQEQLTRAQAKLAELGEQLEKELQEKEVLSQQSRQVLAEKKEAVLELEKQLSDLRVYIVPEKNRPAPRFSEIVHAPDSKIVPILETVSKIGSDDIPVLITGETGTGKEVIARAIHRSGVRKSAPFVAVNCGALAETLLESELFGHEKGSFTGATSRRQGRFELADGGTIFLDEITETTPAFQAKLLRVLQEGAFERIGGEKTLTVDVRVIAATNRDVQKNVKDGRFREDLFYRLNGFPIFLPPLRERQGDIPLLAVFFLKKYGYKDISAFSDRTMEIFLNYYWPGNVRELENVIRRAALLAQSDGRKMIQVENLPDDMIRQSDLRSNPVEFIPLEVQILEMLRSFRFSYSAIGQTARALGNRDRGTITEYFRGLCFKSLVEHRFDVARTARDIAGTDDRDCITRVETKITEYLNNLQKEKSRQLDNIQEHPSFKGLPQKYHSYLEQVIRHLIQNRARD